MTWSYVSLTMLAVNIQGAPATRPCLRGNFPRPPCKAGAPVKVMNDMNPASKKSHVGSPVCGAKTTPQYRIYGEEVIHVHVPDAPDADAPVPVLLYHLKVHFLPLSLPFVARQGVLW